MGNVIDRYFIIALNAPPQTIFPLGCIAIDFNEDPSESLPVGGPNPEPVLKAGSKVPLGIIRAILFPPFPKLVPPMIILLSVWIAMVLIPLNTSGPYISPLGKLKFSLIKLEENFYFLTKKIFF